MCHCCACRRRMKQQQSFKHRNIVHCNATITNIQSVIKAKEGLFVARITNNAKRFSIANIRFSCRLHSTILNKTKTKSLFRTQNKDYLLPEDERVIDRAVHLHCALAQLPSSIANWLTMTWKTKTKTKNNVFKPVFGLSIGTTINGNSVSRRRWLNLYVCMRVKIGKQNKKTKIAKRKTLNSYRDLCQIWHRWIECCIWYVVAADVATLVVRYCHHHYWSAMQHALQSQRITVAYLSTTTVNCQCSKYRNDFFFKKKEEIQSNQSIYIVR